MKTVHNLDARFKKYNALNFFFTRIQKDSTKDSGRAGVDRFKRESGELGHGERD